jgi:hypothetical protein
MGIAAKCQMQHMLELMKKPNSTLHDHPGDRADGFAAGAAIAEPYTGKRGRPPRSRQSHGR